MPTQTYDSVMAQLKAWASSKRQRPTAFPEQLQNLSRELKTDHVLAQQLWFTGNPDAMLVASAAFDPAELTEAGVVRMVEQLIHPQVLDELVANTLVRTPFARSLRDRWLDQPGRITSRAGWAILFHELTAGSLAEEELERVLAKFEGEPASVPKARQEDMSRCLAEIGARSPNLRQRCARIGERLDPISRVKRAGGLVSLYGPFRMPAPTCCAR
jgi:3-methyladenine DNA glycosylase AlkD